MTRTTFALLAVSALLAGCLAVPGAPVGTSGLPDLPLPLLRDDRLHLEVPVPVVLVGFPPEAVEALRGMLDTETVDHRALNLNQPLPPDPSRPMEQNVPLGGGLAPLPFVPTARYAVVAAGEAVEDALAERLPTWRLDDRGELAVYDGRALEDFLAEALPAAGHALARDTPSIVLVHLDAHGVDLHTWRYDFQHGYLEPTRIFGERTPMLVMDLSATRDPQQALLWQVADRATGHEQPRYGDRLSTDAADLERIAGHVREATHFRILQGSIYPVPLADCHAITLIYAYRPTAVAEHTAILRSAKELFDPTAVEGAFRNLTGATVHVDVKVLELPKDDPVLDAIVRGEFATFDVQRGWFTLNWDKYWVAHEGCEAYVSFVISGDVASTPTGVAGIGTYDATRGYRISMSWMNEALRLVLDPDSPLNDDPSFVYNYINYLFTHETGHILGMRHPHDTSRAEGGAGSTAYQDVWSAMSYSGRGRVIDFGAIDQANYQRNRAGFLASAALAAGHDGTPEMQRAFEHLGRYEWQAANDVLWPLVRDAAPAGGAGDLDLVGLFVPRPGTLAERADELRETASANPDA